LQNNYFKIYFLPSQTLKISPVVSKKISKKAVVRNKNKRRIRALASEVFNNGLYAIVVRKDISNIDFTVLKNEFKKIAGKIN
jgi:ribonuclease P protein component